MSMGSDLISRTALLEEIKLQKWHAGEIQNQSYRTGFIASLSILEGKITEIPVVDAEPVRRGEWTEPYKNDIWDCYVCSSCGYAQDRTSRYCPECGARMDGELEHE